jgi:hypothetical protein
MKTTTSNPGDDALSQVLREARPAPGLPPRFQENVWRRIEQAESPATAGWIEALAALVLKPRFAVAAVCTLVLAGALLGTLNGTAHIRESAQERYVTSVAMTLGH